MIDVEKALTSKFPGLFHEKEVNQFLTEHKNLKGFAFIEKVLEYFNFSYSVSNIDKENIPATGKVVIIANHPLGGLDALSLIQLIGEVRKDVKIVANDILMHIDPIKELLLPVDNMTGGNASKEGFKRIIGALNNEEAVIVFPSGEVSRVRPTGIKDTRWKNGFLRFATKTNAPILPIFIHARNSSLFYTISMIYKPLASLLLPQEMFNKHNKRISFRVGEPIPIRNIDSINIINKRNQVKLVKRHLYQVSRGKRPVFTTEKVVGHPEDPKAIKRELADCELLGATSDQKKIYLFDDFSDSAVMREIGRLREITFRKVGEGTGKKRDTDKYDRYYRHLVLWDDEELEIVGAYRIGESDTIFQEYGVEGFYTHTLFEFGEGFTPYLSDSIELGRSFVQPKYWGSRALDYLWQGIGAYLKSRPNVRYMFGPVSISHTFPKLAKDLLIYFYMTYFGGKEGMVTHKNRYMLSRQELEEYRQIIKGDDYTGDFRTLKQHLAHLGVTVPTLYKQYSELCEPGGVTFLDFGVDVDFENCVDGFILVYVEKVKEQKRKRYMGEE